MNEETLLYKQLFAFSSILFVALALSFVFAKNKTDLKDIKQKAAAAANATGEVFKQVMTEDLNANLK